MVLSQEKAVAQEDDLFGTTENGNITSNEEDSMSTTTIVLIVAIPIVLLLVIAGVVYSRNKMGSTKPSDTPTRVSEMDPPSYLEKTTDDIAYSGPTMAMGPTVESKTDDSKKGTASVSATTPEPKTDDSKKGTDSVSATTTEPKSDDSKKRPIEKTTQPSDLFPHWDKKAGEPDWATTERRLILMSLWARKLLKRHGSSLLDNPRNILSQMSKESPRYPTDDGHFAYYWYSKYDVLSYESLQNLKSRQQRKDLLESSNMLAKALIEHTAEAGMTFEDFEELRIACDDITSHQDENDPNKILQYMQSKFAIADQ